MAQAQAKALELKQMLANRMAQGPIEWWEVEIADLQINAEQQFANHCLEWLEWLFEHGM